MTKDEPREKDKNENRHTFSLEPNEEFKMGKHEAWNKGPLVDLSFSLLYVCPIYG